MSVNNVSASQLAAMSYPELQRLIIEMAQQNHANYQKNTDLTQQQQQQVIEHNANSLKNENPSFGRQVLQSIGPGLGLIAGNRIIGSLLGGNSGGGGGALGNLLGGGSEGGSLGASAQGAGDSYDLASSLGGSDLFGSGAASEAGSAGAEGAAGETSALAEGGPYAAAAIAALLTAQSAKDFATDGKRNMQSDVALGLNPMTALPYWGSQVLGLHWGHGQNYIDGQDRGSAIDALSPTGDLSFNTASGGKYNVSADDFRHNADTYNVGKDVTPEQVAQANGIVGINADNNDSASTLQHQMAALVANAIQAGVSTNDLSSALNPQATATSKTFSAGYPGKTGVLAPPDATLANAKNPIDPAQYNAGLPGNSGGGDQSFVTAAIQKALQRLQLVPGAV